MAYVAWTYLKYVTHMRQCYMRCLSGLSAVSEPLNTKFPNLAYVAHKKQKQAVAVLIVSSTF